MKSYTIVSVFSAAALLVALNVFVIDSVQGHQPLTVEAESQLIAGQQPQYGTCTKTYTCKPCREHTACGPVERSSMVWGTYTIGGFTVVGWHKVKKWGCEGNDGEAGCATNDTVTKCRWVPGCVLSGQTCTNSLTTCGAKKTPVCGAYVAAPEAGESHCPDASWCKALGDLCYDCP